MATLLTGIPIAFAKNQTMAKMQTKHGALIECLGRLDSIFVIADNQFRTKT